MADPTLALSPLPTPETLRAALVDSTLRIRDLATQLGVGEAQLLAAQAGEGVTRIAAHPDGLVGGIAGLGDMLALTRNESAVSEVNGTYLDYRAGDHASMVLGPEIDLRIFPGHWVHGFAVETETKAGIRRSFQVFDSAGDAVHKSFLPVDADPSGWLALRDRLKAADQSDWLDLEARKPAEAAIEAPEKAAKLREEWDAMGDTHQFIFLLRKLRINRLGAYRVVGEPNARLLAPTAFATMMDRLAETGVPSMFFTGNRGCIQIRSGSFGPIKPMGPWLNILEPRFNLHLRGDHIAEVWAVTKPTRRGPAVSVEAFDKDGTLILQVFGHRTAEVDHNAEWMDLVAGLPVSEPAV